MNLTSSATLRIVLLLLQAVCLVVSALMTTVPARAQADSTRILTSRGLSFALPGPDWQQIDDPSAPSNLLVQVAHAEPLHRQDIRVTELEAPAVLSPAEISAQEFEADRKATTTGGRWELSQPSTRTVNGVTYPVLAGQFTPDAGTPVINSLELPYFPQDFDQRHRLYALVWSDFHSATVPAKELADFDALVSSIDVRPVGTVLLFDDLTDPASGALPDSSADPDHYQRGYVDGEYVLQKVDPEWETKVVEAFVPQTFADTTLAVDTRLVSESAPQWVELACRVDPKNSRKQYRLILEPDRARLRFMRDDDGQWQTLVDWRQAPYLSGGGETNHVELTCAGSTFSAIVNGQAVFQVQDTKYREGRLELIVEATKSIVDGRFSNLVVTQR